MRCEIARRVTTRGVKQKGVTIRRLGIAVLAASTIAAASASVATAADLPIRKAPAPAPALSWTGFYIGAHVGAGWGTIETEVPGGGFALASGTVNGFLGGGQIGYNWQTGPIVIGVEADVSVTNIKGTTPCLIGILVCERKTDWMSTFAGRLGFIADRALIYVKGGAAWANFNHDTSIAGFNVASADHDQWGALIGTGVEYAFASNWSAKIEYNFIKFEKDTVAFTTAGFGTTNVDVSEYLHAIKFGVNYKFGAPVAAYY